MCSLIVACYISMAYFFFLSALTADFIISRRALPTGAMGSMNLRSGLSGDIACSCILRGEEEAVLPGPANMLIRDS